MNERFIPLKVDGEREPSLIQILRITGYPTIVLAAPDKRILNTMEGYQESEKLHDSLQKMLASLTPTDGMTRNLQMAAKWVSTGEFARAIPVLRGLLDDAKAKPLHPQAAELMQKLEQNAADASPRRRTCTSRGRRMRRSNR